MPVFGSPVLAALDFVVAEELVGAPVVPWPVVPLPVVPALPEPPTDPVLGDDDPVLGVEPPPEPEPDPLLEDPCTTTVPCMNGWIEQM